MNGDMLGMEVQAIRNLAKTMEDRASEIERLTANASNEVSNLAWRGDDRDRFVREWDQVHARELRRTAAGLREAASLARRKASEQEQASSAH